MMKRFALLPTLVLLLLSSHAYAGGPIQTIWGCSVPCVGKDTHEDLGAVEVAYCATSVLSVSMISGLTPLCRAKSGREDAVAVRASDGMVATCDSSSNSCSGEGLVKAGFVCNVMCPSEDRFVHKFTACATHGEEAWSYAKQVCADAMRPDSSVVPSSLTCAVVGQTSCD